MNTEDATNLSVIDPDYLKAMIVVSVLILVMFFLATLLQKVLEYRLKNKILDKGISETLASTILNDESKKHSSVKWFLIFTGLGIGLLLVNFYLPLGVHSFAIMALSLAISFLFSHLYLKYFDK